MRITPAGHIRVPPPPISIVGTTSNSEDSAQFSTALPAGMQEGDVVLVFGCRNLNLAHNVPSGWAGRVDNGAAGPNAFVDYKVMGATPDISYALADDASSVYSTAIVTIAYRGVDAVTPFDVADTLIILGSGMPNSPSITTVTDDALVLSAGFLDNDWVSDAGAPTGFSGLASQQSVNSSWKVTEMVAHKQKSIAGAEDPTAFTGTGDDSNYGYTLALRPGA